MVRTALALVLSISFSSAAFAQQAPQDKVLDAITTVKNKITEFDDGRATWLVKTGSKVTLYSLAAYGLASAALAPVAEGYVVPTTRLGKFKNYRGWYRVKPGGFNERLAKRVVNSVGLGAASLGVVTVGAGLAGYLFENIYFRMFGNADQHDAALAAEQRDLLTSFSQPTEKIYARAQQDPAYAAAVVELADAIQLAH